MADARKRRYQRQNAVEKIVKTPVPAIALTAITALAVIVPSGDVHSRSSRVTFGTAAHSPECELPAIRTSPGQPRLPLILPPQRGKNLRRVRARFEIPRHIRADPARGIGAHPAALLVAQPGIVTWLHATCP